MPQPIRSDNQQRETTRNDQRSKTLDKDLGWRFHQKRGKHKVSARVLQSFWLHAERSFTEPERQINQLIARQIRQFKRLRHLRISAESDEILDDTCKYAGVWLYVSGWQVLYSASGQVRMQGALWQAIHLSQ
jgi:hypothetical protein